MAIPTLIRPAFLAGLGAASLLATPDKDDPHKATIINRSGLVWELRLEGTGHGILQVTRKAKGGSTTTREYGPTDLWSIRLKHGSETTLSFLESKGLKVRVAALGELGAAQEQAIGLYIQDGSKGLELALSSKGPTLRQEKGNLLEILAPESLSSRPTASCTIL